MDHLYSFLTSEMFILSLCAVVIGITKAGFGGGTGILVTPILVLIMPPKTVIGLMLPLLIATDIFSLFHYWGKWDRRNVLVLIPGAMVGILLGGGLLGIMPDEYLRKAIGLMAIAFAVCQVSYKRIGGELTYTPRAWYGLSAGLVTGTVSTIAHVGGVITSIYLLPQKLSNQAFVGTTTIVYFLINATKAAVYAKLDILNPDIIQRDVWLIPTILAGVVIGVFLNKRMSSEVFSKIIFFVVVITGVKLLFA